MAIVKENAQYIDKKVEYEQYLIIEINDSHSILYMGNHEVCHTE